MTATSEWDATSAIEYDLSWAIEGHRRQPAWRVDPERAVVLVHDMQRYFLRRFSQDREPAVSLLAHVERLVQAARARSVPVIYTAQNGDMTEEQRGLLAAFWGPGMVADLADRGIPRRFAPAAGDRVLAKWRYSAFHRTELLQLLRSSTRDQIIITGIYGHIGIQTTAVEAYSNDIETFVVSDAIADFSADEHRQALRYLAGSCAVVLPTAEVLTELGPVRRIEVAQEELTS